MSSQSKEYDIYKDSLWRYLGYANEVGESFRHIVPVNVVWFSYLLATGYVVADATDKGYKMWKKEGKMNKVAIASVDTLIWQGFASVLVPGFTINRICWATSTVLQRATKLPGPVQKWSVVAMGLGSIPFIVKPIDRGVDWFMDHTFRRLYGHH